MREQDISGRQDFSEIIAWTPIAQNKERANRVRKSLNDLCQYVKQRGELPLKFRPIGENPRSKFLVHATHISDREWEWPGKYNLLVFVAFAPQDVDSFRVIAILPSRTKPLAEQRKQKNATRDHRLKRTEAAMERKELTRFRL